MATPTLDPGKVIGHKVLDAAGNKIGQAGQVYQDGSADHQQWVLVKSGLLGRGHLAPMSGANLVADDVQLAFSREQVDGAPDLDMGRPLSAQDESALYQYYGLGAGGSGFPTAKTTERTRGTGMGTGTGMGAGAGEYLVRSEERMQVGTESLEAGHAKLHKWASTERVTRTVPVMHEEVRIDREPIEPGAADVNGYVADWAESEQDMVLHEERAVVRKESVPVERVRMRMEQVTEDVSVTEDLRTEHIDYEEDELLRERAARTQQLRTGTKAGTAEEMDPRNR